jgi:hypothetical protein
VGPVEPIIPVGPVAPVAPVLPFDPVAPVGPVSPVGPVAPVTPQQHSDPVVVMFSSPSGPSRVSVPVTLTSLNDAALSVPEPEPKSRTLSPTLGVSVPL